MITVCPNERCFEFRGLSTDTKPIGNNCSNKNVDYPISNGSVYLEMNTSKVYMLKITESDGEYSGTWIEVSFFKSL